MRTTSAAVFTHLNLTIEQRPTLRVEQAVRCLPTLSLQTDTVVLATCCSHAYMASSSRSAGHGTPTAAHASMVHVCPAGLSTRLVLHCYITHKATACRLPAWPCTTGRPGCCLKPQLLQLTHHSTWAPMIPPSLGSQPLPSRCTCATALPSCQLACSAAAPEAPPLLSSCSPSSSSAFACSAAARLAPG